MIARFIISSRSLPETVIRRTVLTTKVPTISDGTVTTNDKGAKRESRRASMIFHFELHFQLSTVKKAQNNFAAHINEYVFCSIGIRVVEGNR